MQVGGGALASACAEGLREAAALAAIPAPPRLHTVQTEGAWPLRRAFDALTASCASRGAAEIATALAYAAHHRSEFMWPWESEPHSIAHGILDDETYDWLAVVEGMLSTGGSPLVVDETTLRRPTSLPTRRRPCRLTRPGRPASPASSRSRQTEPSPRTSASPCCSPESSGRNHDPNQEGTEMRSFAGRDILSLKGFERAEFERVFEVADELAPIARNRKNADLLSGKTLLTAFYQPSTRTRLATEAAMHRLGGHVLGFSDAKNTRAGDFYQESIKDTVHMLEYYGDVIAMRHFQQGAPAEAARWSSVPVINCGDGWGEHPTQVLTDLYTTQCELGSIDGLTFLLVGDMRMRTMHSILYAMSQFDAKAYVVGPPEMSLLPEFKAELDELSVRYEEAPSVADVIHDCDVIYMEPVVQPDYTKSRDERGETVGLTPEAYRVTRELLRDKGKPESIVLHSLPRMDELPEDVDGTRHARYWSEAFNGVVMRMALISLVLGAME